MTNNLPQIICAGHICNCHNLTYLDWVCPFLVHTHISLTFSWRCRFGTLHYASRCCFPKSRGRYNKKYEKFRPQQNSRVGGNHKSMNFLGPKVKGPALPVTTKRWPALGPSRFFKDPLGPNAILGLY